MGEYVYTLDDNLEKIIRKDGIEGIIVSPMRAQASTSYTHPEGSPSDT